MIDILTSVDEIKYFTIADKILIESANLKLVNDIIADDENYYSISVIVDKDSDGEKEIINIVLNENININEREHDNSIIDFDLTSFYDESYPFMQCYVNLYFNITKTGTPSGLENSIFYFKQFTKCIPEV